jgi:uncharacterized membrane protein YbaN (DUF454 family)
MFIMGIIGHIPQNNFLPIVGIAFLLLIPPVFYFQRADEQIYERLYRQEYHRQVLDADEVRSKTCWACFMFPLTFICFFWSMSVNNPFTSSDFTFSKQGEELKGFTLINPLKKNEIEPHGPPSTQKQRPFANSTDPK